MATARRSATRSPGTGVSAPLPRASGMSCKGIDIVNSNFQNPQVGVRTFEEKITNTGGSPGMTHCEVNYTIIEVGGAKPS